MGIMKSSLACPKCQSRQLWQIDRVAQNYESGSGTLPQMRTHVLCCVTPTGGERVLQAGFLEVWICAVCGFSEWYARDCNSGLAEMAALPNSGVRFVDTTPQRGPFR